LLLTSIARKAKLAAKTARLQHATPASEQQHSRCIETATQHCCWPQLVADVHMLRWEVQCVVGNLFGRVREGA
jgi:hypothetical protein